MAENKSDKFLFSNQEEVENAESAAAGDSAQYQTPQEENFYYNTFNSSAEETNLLKQKLSSLTHKFNQLVIENAQNSNDLELERSRVLHLQRQMQVVKENHGVIRRLHRAFLLKLKNQKTSGKEVENKSVQTWDGMLCRACLDTEKMRRDLEQLQNCILVKPDQFERIQTTVKLIQKYAHASSDQDCLKLKQQKLKVDKNNEEKNKQTVQKCSAGFVKSEKLLDHLETSKNRQKQHVKIKRSASFRCRMLEMRSYSQSGDLRRIESRNMNKYKYSKSCIDVV